MVVQSRRLAPLAMALLWVAALAPMGCATGRDALASLVAIEDEPAGDNCAAGGVRVQSGLDLNGNGTLEANEATMTRYVCDGGAGGGAAFLTSVSREPAGALCASGGVRIEVGRDTNASGALDPEEVTSSEVACDGGGGGGPSSLTAVAPEPAGANCASGGTRVETGLDTSGDGTLDAGEVTSTSYVCNGGGGGTASLTSVVSESSGANCAEGGVRIQTGPDSNGNGTLDAGEVSSTSYVCNGASGSGGGAGTGVTVVTDAAINSSNSAVTLQTATVTTSGPGTILAVGNVDIFCSAGSAPQCGSGNTDYFVRLTPSASDDPTAGDHSFGFLGPDATASVSRSGVFDVPNAGSWSVRMRGLAARTGGTAGFYRRTLSLVFVPR